MEPFYLNGTDETPQIHFNKSTGIFEISGYSLPEEVINFYAPVIDWVENYVLKPNDKTLLIIKLIYFNSASQRYLLEVLNSFEKIKQKGKEINIEWHYHEDDEDLREAGEEYQELVNIPFIFRTYQT